MSFSCFHDQFIEAGEAFGIVQRQSDFANQVTNAAEIDCLQMQHEQAFNV